MEINKINIKNDNIYFNKYINICNIYKVPLLATNNVRFLNKNDFEYHQIKVSIYNNSLNKVNNNKIYTKEQYFKNKNEMISLFNDIPESLINTFEVSKRCNLILNFKKKFLPIYSKNKKYKDNDILIKLSKKGLYKILKKTNK